LIHFPEGFISGIIQFLKILKPYIQEAFEMEQDETAFFSSTTPYAKSLDIDILGLGSDLWISSKIAANTSD
jgi:hypothetical protein